MKEYAQAPQVRSAVIWHLLNHLVRIITRCPSATLDSTMLRQTNGKSEVAQIDFHVVVDHDILRLDVSVNNFAIVARS